MPGPSAKRKVWTVAGVALGVVAALVLAVYGVSWARASPVQQVPFFEARPGEHQPLVFAHQGGESIRPTNTMVAFVDSVALGADVVDTDMHMTSDGELVLLHDETVDRTSDGTGAVRDLTLAELRELDFAYEFSTDGGETFPYRGQGHGIVTVDELFTEFRPEQVRISIEIKQTTPEAATTLCELIEQYDYVDDVIVNSFTQPNMDAFRETCPTVATSATEDEARRFYIFQRVGLVGLYNPPFQALQVPEYSGDTHVVTGGFVGNAHERGLKVIPWTIDEPEDFDRMIALDVDGINTNRPDLLADDTS